MAAGSLLVVASAVSQTPNDKQQLEPMLDKIEALADELGKPECLLADTGYFSAANVESLLVPTLMVTMPGPATVKKVSVPGA